MQAAKLLAAVLTCVALLALLALLALPVTRSYSLLMLPIVPVQILYGGKHWGGVGSEGYGTSAWDNSGWNEHYHPRDGASMDSESMEPYTWRKGPRVNDEYTGIMVSGDPTVDPPDSWEPPINFKKSRKQILVDKKKTNEVRQVVAWNYRPLHRSLHGTRTLSLNGAKLPYGAGRSTNGFMQLYGGKHWGGVGSEGYGTSAWDNSGWNEHYHPRDGASMDSESMEPYTWRKGPRVNDEYTGIMASGDPTVDPPDSWEPPINFKKSRKQILVDKKKTNEVRQVVAWNYRPLHRSLHGTRTLSLNGAKLPYGAGRSTNGFMQLYGGKHWGGVGSEGYGTSAWDSSGWNEHYHPRDGASMDSESMEPYTWRKGPRVNDEYTGIMASGDPTVDPPDSWEPPINFH